MFVDLYIILSLINFFLFPEEVQPDPPIPGSQSISTSNKPPLSSLWNQWSNHPQSEPLQHFGLYPPYSMHQAVLVIHPHSEPQPQP